MAELLNNAKVENDSGEFATILSPTDKLAQGIKAILEVFEENGVPKYKVEGIAKAFGSVLNIDGVPQGSVDFKSQPQAQIDALESYCDALDGTKADKVNAFIYVGLGVVDLTSGSTFDISPDKIAQIRGDNAVMLDVADNTSGKHRNFMRTQISADGGTITFVESVDMGTKKAPSINEIDVDVANGQGTYTEVALQNRLTQIDLDNIASIPQKQNSTDNSLQTTDKTIVGAINELKTSGGASKNYYVPKGLFKSDWEKLNVNINTTYRFTPNANGYLYLSYLANSTAHSYVKVVQGSLTHYIDGYDTFVRYMTLPVYSGTEVAVQSGNIKENPATEFYFIPVKE